MSDREDLTSKIPAFLRGELRDEIRQKIETLEAQDVDFAAEIEFQRAIKATLISQDETSDHGHEFGWARLSKAIDAEKPAIPVAANENKPSHFWKYATACLAVIAIGQASFSTLRSDKNADDQYVMAGQTETSVAMRVSLDPTASTETLTRLLISVDGVITSGPDANGQYTIDFADQNSCEIASKRLETEDSIFETYTACGEP